MRIRKSWNVDLEDFTGPAEYHEAYASGKKRTSMSITNSNEGRSTVGKTAVLGAKDRETNQVQAQVIENTTAEILTGFVYDTSSEDAQLYTDDFKGYQSLKRADHETVEHSVKEYVNGEAHINGMQSFWSLLKHGYYGRYHRMSPKHLQCYVNEFVGRHNIRDYDTVDQRSVQQKVCATKCFLTRG